MGKTTHQRIKSRKDDAMIQLSAAQIKGYIDQILLVLGPISRFTETKIDDKVYEVLDALRKSDALIDLVSKWLAGDDKVLETITNSLGEGSEAVLMKLRDEVS